MANFRSGSYLDDQKTLQAKMIVLGDHGTGKSCLINSLDSRMGGTGRSMSRGSRFVGRQNVGNGEDVGSSGNIEESIFSILEFPASELDATNSNVYLKMWEHTHGLSKEEEELVFRGALFCIITLDLRKPESAQSAFNKWLSLKDTHMPESFLFVVGTYLDQSISRRVEIAELCKACAQRDAIYLEVSNLDGSNVSLLRRLVAQRINYMLRVRETVARQALPDLSGRHLEDTLEESTVDGDESVNESKNNNSSAAAGAAAGRRESALKSAFLEQEIVCDSVGSILASCLGTELWPGYENEEESLKQIGDNICEYVRRLALDPASAPSTPLEHVLHCTPPVLGGRPSAVAPPEPNIDELKAVFEVMGFQLPPTLLTTAASSSPKRAVATAMRSIKLRVKLPTGKSADMILFPGYHVGQQVDAFLTQHEMQDDDEARAKLFEVAKEFVVNAARQHDQHEGEDAAVKEMLALNHQNALLAKPSRLTGTGAGPGRKIRVRIALPNGGQVIETVMNENDDLVAISKRISRDHGLSAQYQERVLEQLRSAFK